jgi:L-ascorbate metabolism protein UlaG (beta-lactamase superfamily)
MSAFGSKPSGLRLERMKSSPRYHDGVFRNTHNVGPRLKTPLKTMGKFLFGCERRVPLAPLPLSNPRDTWQKPVQSGLRATWLGHSTVLVEIDGFRVLTDPVWGERASPTRFAGPKRFQPMPVPISALPPLDAIVLSHDHYDHLDYPTILELLQGSVPIVTSLGVGAHLEAFGIAPERIKELDWWEHAELPGGLIVTAAPSQHFSGRSMSDRNVTLWSSMIVRGPRHSFFFSGDTGLTPEYEEIKRRLGPFDLVMLEVGAFNVAWGDIHLGPENALSALAMLGGGPFLPVHWGTFNLAMHAWDDTVETLLQLAPKQPRAVQLVLPRLGEPVEPAHVERVDPWWRAIAALEKDAPAAQPEEAAEPMLEPID